MPSLKPDRPIDPLAVALIREVDTAVKELKLTYLVCGALARDILLQHLYGIPTGTATVDVDFGVAVENWEQFNLIKARLVETRKFEAAKKTTHRLYYKSRTTRRGYPIDLIPFGKIENPPNSIAWPPDGDQVMSVIGYDEALATAVEIEIEPEFVIPVISLPGLALLKLFAWMDRSNETTKDAMDLATLLSTYDQAGNEDRLWGEEIKMLESAGFNLTTASPELLGKDVGNMARPETLEKALGFLRDAKRADQLATHMAPSLRHHEDSVAEAQRLLERFKAGLVGH